MLQITVNQLKNLPLFREIDDKTINLIKEKAYIKTLKKGEILFSERQKVDNIYIVLEGKVTMYRLSEKGQKRVIYILNKGEIINEVIFDNLTSSINCEGFENSEVIGISKIDLLNIIQKDFKLTEVVLYSMSKKIRRLYRQIKNTVPTKMDKRVAAKLWKLSKDYGVETEEGVLINVKISITYLADMLGSSRETISRAVKELEKMDMVKIKQRKFIVNREKLNQYFKTENECIEPKQEEKKILVFLRSCDVHALTRLDEIYLRNGNEDYYYKVLRDKIKFVLMGCSESFENCFCVSMGSNKTEVYDMYAKLQDDEVFIDCKSDELMDYFMDDKAEEAAGTRNVSACIGASVCPFANYNTTDFAKKIEREIFPNDYYVKIALTGYPVFKEWVLKDITLGDKAEVKEYINW